MQVTYESCNQMAGGELDFLDFANRKGRSWKGARSHEKC